MMIELNDECHRELNTVKVWMETPFSLLFLPDPGLYKSIMIHLRELIMND